MLAGRTFQRAVSVATVARRGFAAPAAATAAAQLVLNFTTPHAPVYAKKTVEVVSIPGAAGEYGVTAGHSPIISELKPGVVTVVHTGVRAVFDFTLNSARRVERNPSFM